MITPQQIAELRVRAEEQIEYSKHTDRDIGSARLSRMTLAVLDEHALLVEVADAADSATRGGFELPRLRAALDALRKARGAK